MGMSLNENPNPFVGLRPFQSNEGLLFFGRDEQILKLLRLLHLHHFVAVVGNSGSGKSSLVLAGLIPKLKAAYLVNDRDQWLITIFKPGESPLYNLALTLLTKLSKNSSDAAVQTLLQKIEEDGADAITELLRTRINETRTNILIVVDQFEELFRFAMNTTNADNKNKAITFVNILLALSRNEALPIYTILTMRSDFIGDCSQFLGLPEALNESQYLVPRLTREQLKNAIEGPIRLYGKKINPALTSKLLNDVQIVTDALPLLQHALLRIWDYAMQKNQNNELKLEDYVAVGGIEKALSNDADAALNGLDEEERHIAELMFQALTTIDEKKEKQGGRPT